MGRISRSLALFVPPIEVREAATEVDAGGLALVWAEPLESDVRPVFAAEAAVGAVAPAGSLTGLVGILSCGLAELPGEAVPVFLDAVAIFDVELEALLAAVGLLNVEAVDVEVCARAGDDLSPAALLAVRCLKSEARGVVVCEEVEAFGVVGDLTDLDVVGELDSAPGFAFVEMALGFPVGNFDITFVFRLDAFASTALPASLTASPTELAPVLDIAPPPSVL